MGVTRNDAVTTYCSSMVLLPRYKVLVGLVAWLTVCGVWFLVYGPVVSFTTTGHYMLPSPQGHHARPPIYLPHHQPGPPQHPPTHVAHTHQRPALSLQGGIPNTVPEMRLQPPFERTVQKKDSGGKKVKQYYSGNTNSIKGISKSDISRMTNGNVINEYDVSSYKGDYNKYYSEDEGDTDKEGEYESYSHESDIDEEDEYDERQYEASENYESNPEYDSQATEDYEHDTDYADYEREDDEYEWTGGQYNVTPATRILMYNRVPKCASSTMQTILRRLSRRLRFSHESSLVYNKRQLSDEEQMELQDNLTNFANTSPSRALSYDRHLYYTNFTLYGGIRPVYINIIRNPVERFISSFYYIRSEERIARVRAQGHLVSPSTNWSNRTIGQCVLANLPECSFHQGEEKETMLTYFCGHHHFCRIVGSREALQVAKRVVSGEYSVVGLVEHMELSLKLMETLVPRYFMGALRIYENMKRIEKTNINSNHQKPHVSLTIRKKLMRRFANDLDFYNFLKQRLFQQGQTFLSH